MSHKNNGVTISAEAESLAIDYIRKHAANWQGKGAFFTQRPSSTTKSLKEVFETIGIPVVKDNVGHYTCLDALVKMGRIGLAARASGPFLYVVADLPKRGNGGASQPTMSVSDMRAALGL